jgi:hypothetical protein
VIKVYGYRSLGAIVCKLAQVECRMCVPFSIGIVQVDQSLGCQTTLLPQGRLFAGNVSKD